MARAAIGPMLRSESATVKEYDASSFPPFPRLGCKYIRAVTTDTTHEGTEQRKRTDGEKEEKEKERERDVCVLCL